MKWTLVTGGSRRLGADICQELAVQGYSVLIHYRNSKDEAEDVALRCRKMGVKAEMIYGDFSNAESTQVFAKECLMKYPDIKNLVNNVGNYLVKSAALTTPEEWNALVQTNLNTPFALCHAMIPSIKAHRGHIINIGVVGANNIHADIKRTAYLMTKMSLCMLTKSLARELAPFGVRVNMVSPGYLEYAVDLDGAKLPMERAASSKDVLNAISFLMNENNSYITGQNIEVGGGVGLIN